MSVEQMQIDQIRANCHIMVDYYCKKLLNIAGTATERMISQNLNDGEWSSIHEMEFKVKLVSTNAILKAIPVGARNLYEIKSDKLSFSCGENDTCNADFFVIRQMIQFFRDIEKMAD